MRTLLRSAAATALIAAAGLLGAPPAGAAACTSDSGVTVVVDFNDLRGNDIEQGCVADQGTAADLFVAAGHSLENVNGQPFVCRVDGLPGQDQESCARIPPADRYWGLWWSDGESGSWTYSSQGAYSLDVPEGGSVAFSWNGSSTKEPPGVAPPQHEDEPTQEPSASQQPSQPPPGGGGGGAGGGVSPGGTTGSDPTASDPVSPGADGPRRTDGARSGDREGARDRDGKREREDRQDRQERRDREDDPADEPGPTDDVTDAPTAAEPPASAGDEALPVWVGPTAAGGLLGVAGLAAYLRRRAA